MDPRTNLFGLSREQLLAALAALGEPAYRGGQVYRWLYRKRVRAIAEMTDLPKPVRDKIHDAYVLRWPDVAERSQSFDGTVSNGAANTCLRDWKRVGRIPPLA